MAHTHIQRMKQMQQQQNRFDDYASSQRTNSLNHCGSVSSGGPGSIVSGQQFGSQSSLSRIMSGSAYFPLRAAAAAGGPSNFGGRSVSNSNLAGLSTSLGASKASLATLKSGKSCIQQEFRDIKVQRKFHSIAEGRARQPFLLSILCFIVALACLTAGLTVIIKRAFGQIFLTLDKGEFIGPGVACLSLVFISLGIHFLHSAYKRNAKERCLIRFKASNSSKVSAKANRGAPYNPDEKLVSGTASQNAVTRTPVGSLHSLHMLFQS